MVNEMNKIKTLVKKELLDILRDRKTLVIMVAIPILLYPAIIMGMVLIMSMMAQSQVEKVHTVFYSDEYREEVEKLEEIYRDREDEIDTKLTFVSVNESAQEQEKENADTWISFSKDENGLAVTVEYTSTSQDSGYAENALEKLTDYYRDELVEEKLKAEGLTEEFLHPLTYNAKDSVTVSESAGMNLGGSIGMLLIMTIMLGAFYPAIDVTTGEKERGTLETLLTLPVTNFQMIMSKYIAVSILACVTAVLSLLSLGVSVLFLLSSVTGEASGGLEGFRMSAMIGWIPVLLLVVIVTALLITAFCMCFCIFAKSFKEANNYITPVMLIVMFASMVGMVPSIQLDYKTSLIPIVNVSLLIKQVMAQQMNLALAGITILVNLCYSVLIIWILAKMYDSENVLFTDGFQCFRLFEKRSEIKRGTVPKLGDLILSMVVLLLLILYLGNAISVRSALGGTVVNQMLILAVPLFVVWYMKSDVKKLFLLKAPKIKSILGGLLLYIGSYCLMLIVSVAMTILFPESAQTVSQSFAELFKQPFILCVLVIAIMPAIGEEIFFRGFLYGSLRNRYSAVWGIILSSLVFGAYHMSLVKLLPTAILGACCAYIAYRSDSIFIGMFLHFLNNMISLVAVEYPEQMEKILPVLMKSQITTVEILGMLAVGLVCVAAGVLILGKGEECI